jgi:hypothetical protein
MMHCQQNAESHGHGLFLPSLHSSAQQAHILQKNVIVPSFQNAVTV